nr:hypothetical protein [Tanacetum cinerariifolium]
YPEYLAPSDDEAPLEDQPLPTNASPTATSPGYMTDSDPEEDPEEAKEAEALEPDEPIHAPGLPISIPFSQTCLRRARKTVRPEPPMSASMEASIA